MPCNYYSLGESKMRCDLGGSEHEQVRESGRQFAASSAACRALAVAWSDASGGGTPGRGDAYHGERLEREAQRGRTAVSAASAPRGSAGTGCRAASRADRVLEERSARARLYDRAVDLAAGRPAHRPAVRAGVQ